MLGFMLFAINFKSPFQSLASQWQIGLAAVKVVAGLSRVSSSNLHLRQIRVEAQLFLCIFE
jgi:hypothetical protein